MFFIEGKENDKRVRIIFKTDRLIGFCLKIDKNTKLENDLDEYHKGKSIKLFVKEKIISLFPKSEDVYKLIYREILNYT